MPGEKGHRRYAARRLVRCRGYVRGGNDCHGDGIRFPHDSHPERQVFVIVIGLIGVILFAALFSGVADRVSYLARCDVPIVREKGISMLRLAVESFSPFSDGQKSHTKLIARREIADPEAEGPS
jgi:hypothetical protein